MSSSKILYKASKVSEVSENLSFTKFPSIKKYIGEKNYETISYKTAKGLESNINKINFINSKFSNKKYLTFLENSLYRIYKLIFSEFMKNEVTRHDIKKRLEDFINISKNINDHNYYSTILFHLSLLNNLEIYFLPLVDKNNAYFYTELFDITEREFKENMDISKKVEKYYSPYNLKYIRKNQKKIKELSEEDLEIKESLVQIFNKVIKKIQKLKNKPFDILTYGSYTANKINPNTHFNDVDFYHTNPIAFLSVYVIITKIIMNIDIDIFQIPFIIGHSSLRYKTEHFADCVYMDTETLKLIPSVIIKDIKFVDPLIQTINNFRMMSELRRISSFSESEEIKKNTVMKTASMIQYVCEDYGINFKKDIKKIDFNVETVDNSFVVNLKKIFESTIGYEEIKDELEFDFLIISRYSPNLLFSFLKKNPGIIRRQYFALFNEIVVEYYKSPKVLKNDSKTKLNANFEVLEESIKEIRPTTLEDTNIEKLIKNNNCLFMSSLCEEFFLKVENEVNGIIKDTIVTNITKENILGSFVLSQILKHKNNKDVVKFYFNMLLSFIFYNDKKNDLKDLSQNDGRIMTLGKYKEKGKHEVFALEPMTRLKLVLFYKKQNKEVYTNIQDFLEVCSYNI